jgi:hypothetical protein
MIFNLIMDNNFIDYSIDIYLFKIMMEITILFFQCRNPTPNLEDHFISFLFYLILIFLFKTFFFSL